MSLPLQNSFNHKHSIYLEGGTPNLRYGVDGSFNLSDGVMKGTERNRYSAGFSLDYRMKNFQIKNYVSFTHTKSKDRKSTRLNSSHRCTSRMPSSA